MFSFCIFTFPVATSWFAHLTGCSAKRMETTVSVIFKCGNCHKAVTPDTPRALLLLLRSLSQGTTRNVPKAVWFQRKQFQQFPTFLRANLDTDAVGCVAVVMTLHKMLQHNGHSISRNSITGSFPLTTFFL